MRYGPTIVGPGTSTASALERMRRDATNELVVSDGRAVLGILTAHEVTVSTKQTATADVDISCLCIDGMPTAAPDETISSVVARTHLEATPVVAVVDHGDIVGVLHLRDLASATTRRRSGEPSRRHS